MTVKIIIMTSPHNASGKSMSIKWTQTRRTGAGGEVGSYSLIVFGFYSVNLMDLNLISHHFIGKKLHYRLISSLLALHLCQSKASLWLMLVPLFMTHINSGFGNTDQGRTFSNEKLFIGLLCWTSEISIIHSFFHSVGHSTISNWVFTRKAYSIFRNTNI